MQLSGSFLSIKDNLKENIKKLDNTNIDYLHLDVMDGIFVNSTSLDIETMKDILQNTKKTKDIHLMVKDVKKYIDDFSCFNPKYITFHLEATNNINELISYIKQKNIMVGISIKPNTNIEQLLTYLKDIDLILLMSVEPGYGGQTFIKETETKIKQLNQLKKINNYKYLIEVDGGINNETIDLCKNADIVVVGSYITNSNNYNEQIEKLQIN